MLNPPLPWEFQTVLHPLPPPPKKKHLPNFVIFQTLRNFCFSLQTVLKSCLLSFKHVYSLNRNSAIQSLQKGLHYYVQPSQWSMQGPADWTSSVTFFSNIRLLISSEESSSQFLYARGNIFDKHQKTSSNTLRLLWCKLWPSVLGLFLFWCCTMYI